MDPRELKPVLTALVLPPTGPLLLAVLGVLVLRWRRALGVVLVVAGLLLALALSTNGMALVLARLALEDVVPARVEDIRHVDAIVVLGGGVLPAAPEFGAPQPSPPTLARLRYGAWIARATGKPLAFAGGVGWAATGTDVPAEATVARLVMEKDYGLQLRWVDDSSRDSAENAAAMARMLRPVGIQRIALVTDATHMERAADAFRSAGFVVLPAPTNFPIRRGRPLLEWLPSDIGISTCRHLVREWLGRWVARVG